MTTFAYLIEEVGGTYVKIGYSKAPVRRVSTVQVGNPRELRLLSVVAHGTVTEREIKKLFKSRHIRGEWHLDNDGLIKSWFRSHVNALSIEAPHVPVSRPRKRLRNGKLQILYKGYAASP